MFFIQTIMRSTFLLLIFLLCAGVNMEAQNRNKPYNLPHIDQRQWQFGFSLAYPLANYKIVHSDFTLPVSDRVLRAGLNQYMSGVSAGMIVNYRLAENLNLRSIPSFTLVDRALNFVEQNEDGSAPIGYGNPVTVSGVYLEVPLYVKYMAKRYTNFRPYVITGFSGRFNWNDNEGALISTKPFELSYDLGFGADFYMFYFKFGIEVRTSIGLNNILNKERPELRLGELYPTKSLDALFSRLFVISLNFE